VAAASVRFALRRFAQLHGQRGSVDDSRKLARICIARSRVPGRVYVSHHELPCANYMPSYAYNAWRNVGAARCIEFYSSFLCAATFITALQYLQGARIRQGHHADTAKHTTRTQRSLVLWKVILHQFSSHACDSPGVGASPTLLVMYRLVDGVLRGCSSHVQGVCAAAALFVLLWRRVSGACWSR
jgi:hypothetical protein